MILDIKAARKLRRWLYGQARKTCRHAERRKNKTNKMTDLREGRYVYLNRYGVYIQRANATVML